MNPKYEESSNCFILHVPSLLDLKTIRNV